MLLKFNYGFDYLGFQYGWYRKELYRLPSKTGKNKYGLKKLNPITVGNTLGYRIKRQKISMVQLKQMTNTIAQVEITIIKENKDIPA